MMSSLPCSKLFEHEVLVVDLETTGLNKDDSVLSIGIVSIDECGRISELFGCVLNPNLYESEYRPKDWQQSWIFQQGTPLTVQACLEGESPSIAIGKVRALLKGKKVTSYRREFDVGLFLSQAPWNVHCQEYPCIMEEASKRLGRWIPEEKRHKWVKLSHAVSTLKGHDFAAKFHFHTAMEDALAAAAVLVELTRLRRDEQDESAKMGAQMR